ncbi:MAG: 50S ribosomal protein L35 [Candidatus Omnitrophica bacterium]|nr:50S ribosomal protein L35 [Candidatus Omnitrophota bacterium]
MPKLKTHKGAKKRVRLSKSGKIKRSRACKGHILTKKTTKRKRHLAQSTVVHKVMHSTITHLLPYGLE